MADVLVKVTGSKLFYEEVMDETAVAAYVISAQSVGYYESPDSDVYIPFNIGEVVVQSEDKSQSGRDAAGNF